MPPPRERAILFVDGNNWFHSLKDIGVADRRRLDYAKISTKLVGPARDWIGTRYYIGRVDQGYSAKLYADQRRFLAALAATDARISAHLGRLEQRRVENPAADELSDYITRLQSRQIRIPKDVFHELLAIAQKHRRALVRVEKAVDVMLAVDMVTMALRNEYDVAYLLSADGDFTPAVEAARDLRKKIFVASSLPGAQLARVAYKFIPLPLEWFKDCY